MKARAQDSQIASEMLGQIPDGAATDVHSSVAALLQQRDAAVASEVAAITRADASEV